MDITSLLKSLKNSASFQIIEGEKAYNGAFFVQLVNERKKLFENSGLEKGNTLIFQIDNSLDSICSLLALLEMNIFIAFLKKGVKSSHVHKLLERYSFDYFMSKEHLSDTVFSNHPVKVLCRTEKHTCVLSSQKSPSQPTISKVSSIGIFSSGSTGEPKLILHSICSVLHNARLHSSSVDMQKNDRVALILPMFYSFGLVANFFGALVSQACLIICNNKAAIMEDLSGWLSKNKITFVSLTPYLLNLLFTDASVTSLKKITIGGDSVSKSIAMATKILFSSCDIYFTYGLTEAGPRVATYMLNQKSIESVDRIPLGKALPGVSLNILGFEKIGELVVSTPTAMIGIAKGCNEVELQTSKDISTGDIFEIKDGQFFFVGRKRDIIKRSGETIYPSEIERTLSEYIGSSAVKVVARQDEVVGEVPIAYIESAPGVSVMDLKRFVRSKLPSSHVPVEFIFLEREKVFDLRKSVNL